ncbi:MAG TPA: cupin domain-containing protein [Actinopolymorphaceae bacterium]
MTVQTQVAAKSLSSPDETRTFANGRLDVATVDGNAVGRATFEPGWRWSESVRPLVGGDSCQYHHTGYVISGSLHVRMDDGAEADLNSSDVYHIPPGHDAWVNGDEPCVMVDWEPTGADYARPT